MIRVRVENPAPPIPWRGCDWCAWDDRYNPDDSNVALGWGASPTEAIADLLDEMGMTPARIDLTPTGALVEAREKAA